MFPLGVFTASSDSSIGGDFQLTDHDGNIFNLKQLRERYVLIYFGFLTCPDICPMELNTISQALSQLEDLDVIGLFITVDPERDSAGHIKSYVSHFHPEIIGLTGTPDDIRRTADQYNVRFQRSGEGSTYTIDHSSHIFILDTLGKIRAIAPFGSTSEHLQNVVRKLEQERK